MDKLKRTIITVNKLCGFNVLFQCLFVFISGCNVKCLWFHIFVDSHHTLLPSVSSFANTTLLRSKIFSLGWAIHLNPSAPSSLSACWSLTTIRWRSRISAPPKSSATRAPRCPSLVRWPGWLPRSYAMNLSRRRWIFGRCHIPFKPSEPLSVSFMISLIYH